MRRWLCLIWSVCLVLCLCGCAFGVAGSEHGKSDSGVTDGVGIVTSETNNSFWSTLNEWRKKLLPFENRDVPQDGHVGYVAEVSSFRVTFVECELDWTGYAEAPMKGYKIARAHFIIENASDSMKSCGNLDFTCRVDGEKCSTAKNGVDCIGLFEEVGAGEVLDGWLYYEVPVSAKTAVLEYIQAASGGSLDTVEFIIE